MSDLKSEYEIFNKKPVTQSHTSSKSSSKYYSINLILNFYLFFINLANFDYNQNQFQLNSNNLFAFPVIHISYLYLFK